MQRPGQRLARCWRQAVWALAVAGTLGGCAPRAGTERGPFGPHQAPPAPQVCPARAVIVKMKPGQCSGQWTVDTRQYVATTLQRSSKDEYCKLTLDSPPAAGDRVRYKDAENLAAQLGAGSAEVDCPVVVPQTDEGTLGAASASTAAQPVSCPLLPPTVTANAYPHALSWTQRMAAAFDSYLGPAWATAPSQPVRVAVVDTAQNDFYGPALPLPDCSLHGRAVGVAIARASCGHNLDPAQCGVRIENRMGLPLLRGDDLPATNGRGGRLGTRGQLIEAIQAALQGSSATPKLIVNLSVGWHGQFNQPAKGPSGFVPKLDEKYVSPPPGSMSVASEAVYLALREASCRGALVIAAAGNAEGADRHGPLYPAGWAMLPAPLPADCTAEFPDLASATAAGGPRPLVYAVSAVDHAGSPLPLTRVAPASDGAPGGLAVRAALGLAVSNKDPRGDLLWPQSGTSMAAAVVSGLAARIWARAPGQSAQQVMHALDAGLGQAPAAPLSPTLAAGQAPSSYHVIRGCAAAGANQLPTAPTCASGLPGVPAVTAPPSAAGSASVATSQPLSSSAAPRLLEPWVGPQPGPPTCSVCSALLSGQGSSAQVYLLMNQTNARPVKVLFYSTNPLASNVQPLQVAVPASQTNVYQLSTSWSPSVPRPRYGQVIVHTSGVESWESLTIE